MGGGESESEWGSFWPGLRATPAGATRGEHELTATLAQLATSFLHGRLRHRWSWIAIACASLECIAIGGLCTCPFERTQLRPMMELCLHGSYITAPTELSRGVPT